MVRSPSEPINPALVEGSSGFIVGKPCGTSATELPTGVNHSVARRVVAVPHASGSDNRRVSKLTRRSRYETLILRQVLRHNVRHEPAESERCSGVSQKRSFVRRGGEASARITLRHCGCAFRLDRHRDMLSVPGREQQQAPHRPPPGVPSGVGSVAWHEDKRAGGGDHEAVAELEGQLALGDVERPVRVGVEVQRRAAVPGRHRADHAAEGAVGVARAEHHRPAGHLAGGAGGIREHERHAVDPVHGHTLVGDQNEYAVNHTAKSARSADENVTAERGSHAAARRGRTTPTSSYFLQNSSSS